MCQEHQQVLGSDVLLQVYRTRKEGTLLLHIKAGKWPGEARNLAQSPWLRVGIPSLESVSFPNHWLYVQASEELAMSLQREKGGDEVLGGRFLSVFSQVSVTNTAALVAEEAGVCLLLLLWREVRVRGGWVPERTSLGWLSSYTVLTWQRTALFASFYKVINSIRGPQPHNHIHFLSKGSIPSKIFHWVWD